LITCNNCFVGIFCLVIALIFHLQPPYHITWRKKLIVLQVINCLCFDYLVIVLITCIFYFFNIRSAMDNKHLELTKRQARDRYGRFTSPSSSTTPPPSLRQEVGGSSRRRTAPPPSDDSSVEIWEVPPPPPTRLGDSSSTSSGYNDECPHVREVSSYEHCF
jgi:hypothetical protein